MGDTEIYRLQYAKDVEINFNKKVIRYLKRGESKYFESDINILNRVLDRELKYLKEKVSDLESRLSQTEVVKIKIPHGYKERQPLNEDMKEVFRGRVKDTQQLIDYLTIIKQEENKK